MARAETVTLMNMCMVYDGTRVLVQNRVSPDWPGITFPGGHVEGGEAFTDAVIREVFEETGLKISEPQLCGVKDWSDDKNTRSIVLLYKTDKFEGALTPSDEGEVFWVELSEFNNLKLSRGMDKLIKVFLEDNISEEFFYKENENWVEVLK